MKELSMPIYNLRCAGIDIGSSFHMVAVDQKLENVKKFGVYSKDHKDLIDWLKANQITSVAMESTGHYWQTLHDALNQAGLEVILANGNQTKNVKGKKTDTLDCLWIQKLHSLGLLSGSFLPAADIQALRTYFRHRQYLVRQCSRYINKMQKALRLMNIRLDIAVNDIMGLSGRKIIDGILAGETDTMKLASLADYRVKKSKEEIALALEGNRREDLMFELSACLSLYDIYVKKIKESDVELESKIGVLVGKKQEIGMAEKSVKAQKQKNKHSPNFNIEHLSHRYYGVNLMEIPNVGANTVLCLLTQIGDDIYKFPTSKHFCSWLRIAPNNKVTGGKLISSRTPKGKNQLALALRQAANTIGNLTKGDLVPFFKRIAFRKDRAAAITATARKLAVIIYNMITKREAYKPKEPNQLSTKAKNKMIKNLGAKIKTLELTKEQLEFLILDSSISTA